MSKQEQISPHHPFKATGRYRAVVSNQWIHLDFGKRRYGCQKQIPYIHDMAFMETNTKP